MFSCSRPSRPNGLLPGGGVTALVSTKLSCTFREDLSCPDLIILDLPDFFLVNSYLPPANSRAKNWDQKEAMESLLQTVNLLNHPEHETTAARKPIVLMGDLNGRIANHQLPGTTSLNFPRHLSDTMMNTRGRWIINSISNPHSLAIVNGTCFEDAQPGKRTSFQKKGSSIIDYAMLSECLLEAVVSLSITRPMPTWDHARLQLVIDAKHSHLATEGNPSTPNPPPSFEPSSPIDFMLEDVMSARLTDEMATRQYYGAPFFHGHSTQAYITSHKNTPGSPRRTCAIARSHNAVDVITTLGSTQNALLTAIAYFTVHADPNTTLVIHLDSDSTIRSLCHDVGPAYLKGSLDAASPLALASSILRKRPGATSFVAVTDNTRGTQVWKAARRLATSPTTDPIPFMIASVDDAPPDWPAPLGEPLTDDEFPKPKVNTQLPPILRSTPKPRSIAQIRRELGRTTAPEDTDKHSESHRGRKADRALMWANLMALRACRSNGEQWRVLRRWTDPKPRPMAVKLSELATDFEGRMNPPAILPPLFNQAKYEHDTRRASLLPDETVDRSPHHSFSRPFTEDEIIWAKKRIRQRPRNSARGVDNAPYHALLSVGNDKLCELFNECIAQKDVPQKWLSTTLVGILKPKKPKTKPESYRIIALECCILKVLTLLIDRRFREWMEDVDLLPDSQNGFREGYRTNNNAFILRHCIDKTVGSGKCLAAVFVDLKNAFPSTNLPTLWIKLHDRGARGPMMDWMRVLYSRMQYRVRAGTEWSEAFTSLWGILAGDSMSPAFFDAYISDFKPPTTESDIIVGDTPIGNMELADDIVEITSTNPRRPDLTHAQEKLTYTEHDYCHNRVFLELNGSKTKCLLVGSKGEPARPLRLEDSNTIIEQVDEFRYGGVVFSSDARPKQLFARNYQTRAAQARSALYSVFATESFVGTLSVHDGVTMYYARIDPYLVHGFEAVIDIDGENLKLLEEVQIDFIRRLLDLNPRCPIAPLFVETGILPIRHRRLILALRYAKYVLSLPDRNYAKKAYLDAITLHRAGKRCWIGDLETALAKLPNFPVITDITQMESSGGIAALVDEVHDSCANHLHKQLQSSRLPLFNDPYRPLNPADPKAFLRKKQYLRTIFVPAHRRAVSKLLTADHGLAIEQYRRIRRRDGSTIPVDERTCRYCEAPTESEIHALFLCPGEEGFPDVVRRRQQFYTDISRIFPSFSVERCLRSPTRCLHFFLNTPDLAPAFGKYVFDMLAMFPGFPKNI